MILDDFRDPKKPLPERLRGYLKEAWVEMWPLLFLYVMGMSLFLVRIIYKDGWDNVDWRGVLSAGIGVFVVLMVRPLYGLAKHIFKEERKQGEDWQSHFCHHK